MGGYVRQRRLLRDLFAREDVAEFLWHNTDLFEGRGSKDHKSCGVERGRLCEEPLAMSRIREIRRKINKDNHHHAALA